MTTDYSEFEAIFGYRPLRALFQFLQDGDLVTAHMGRDGAEVEHTEVRTSKAGKTLTGYTHTGPGGWAKVDNFYPTPRAWDVSFMVDRFSSLTVKVKRAGVVTLFYDNVFF